jgi:hypothetical protein
MTEEEWLACAEPTVMIEHLRWDVGMSARKLRLYACACCRHLMSSSPDQTCEKAVVYGEKIADGLIGDAERTRIEAELRKVRMTYGDGLASSNYASEMAYIAVSRAHPFVLLTSTIAREATRLSAQENMPEETIVLGQLHRLQPAFLREIFGNPYRRRTIDPSLLTSTVIAIAQQIYESRDFSAMPILADALQDAGCDCDGIFTHLRDPNATHVRGCWALDLVLGKTRDPTRLAEGA